jgi:hypothetical protein
VRSPNSDSSERSGSGVLDAESSRLDDQFEDERGNDEVDGEVEIEERKPFEGMREYAESTMQELLAIYGLAGGELAKSVSRQLPPTFLNPSAGQQAQGESGWSWIVVDDATNVSGDPEISIRSERERYRTRCWYSERLSKPSPSSPVINNHREPSSGCPALFRRRAAIRGRRHRHRQNPRVLAARLVGIEFGVGARSILVVRDWPRRDPRFGRGSIPRLASR